MVKGRIVHLIATAAVAAGLIAGCGSSSSSSSSSSSAASSSASSSSSTTGMASSSSGVSAGVAEAQKLVAQWMAPPAWHGPTAPVDIAKAKGKSVYFINLTEEIPALHEWGVVMAQQLALAGVSTQKCDAKGSPNGIILCLQQALAAKPSAIVALALDTKFIASYIAKAKSEGIKFITGQTGTPGIPTIPGDDAEVTFDYGQVGRILADWYVATSHCSSAPQIITSTSSRQPSLAEVAGIESEVKRLCPGMTLPSVQNVLIPDWPTELPTLTRSLLTSNPKLQYLLPLYDGMTIYMNPAIEGIHRSVPVEEASFNGTPVVMQNELAKPSPLAADIGGPNEWYGVALADQVLRVLTGAPVVASENVPLRLFTRANIGSINVHANEATWYGSVNPICEYHKLWGLPCS
ncbi:MAG TPA: substrate-binding domain-containing protein [Solirubrobacteraceae bacterium]|nr:substrate-binding domain-containing protein [Solirubrobacteraceae bacterium]